jgi:uncharacterized phiE125 gp8 family phage protein
MNLTLLTPPVAEPISWLDAKRFLKLDDDAEQTLVTSLIGAARSAVEEATGLCLLAQTWRLRLDAWQILRNGSNATIGVLFPKFPITSIVQLKVDGVMLDAARYTLDNGNLPRLYSASSTPLPLPQTALGGISIDFIAGFASLASIPPAINHALMLLLAAWFEGRTPDAQILPDNVRTLLQPYKRYQL